jgi:hypothetical protein
VVFIYCYTRAGNIHMRLRDDQRGQAIQIGFILIFGVLIISFASYQAFVVPNQNSEVEFNHNQQVQGQLQDLRNAIVSSVRTTASTSVTVDLGTTYPSRLAAANPPPPSGVLRTVGTTDSGVALSVDNAVAKDDETADYWDGSRRSFSTGLLEYQPNYNEYRNAPRTVYDNTLLYNQFGSANVSVTGQTMVDGNQLTFVVLNGSLSAARSGSYSVDVQPVSTSTGVTTVTNAAGADLSVSFPSRFPPEKWNETLASEYEGTPGDDDERHVTDVSGSVRPDGLYDITVTFEDDSYRMRLVKVGVGSGVTDEPAAYLTAADGATSVGQGKSTEVTLSVRDALANPVGEVSVNASAPDGAFERSGTTEAQGVSGPNGKVTFTYEATGTTGTKQLEFSLGTVGSGFDGSTPENATVSVDVTGVGDSVGPEVTSASASPNTVFQGGQVDLSATVSDAGGRGGTDVTNAEWFRAAPGETVSGQDPGEGNANAMNVRGDADQATEEFDDNNTDTSGWQTGDHTIAFRGKDANGNWGPLETRTLTVKGGGGTSSADAVSVATASKTTNDGSTSESIRFTLENTGGAGVNIQNITVDDAGNTDTAQVGNGTRSTGGGPPSYNDDGPELRSNRSAALLDTGSPFSFGSTEVISSTISAGDRTEYRLAEFRTSANGGGVEVDPGSTVTITLGFSDGSDKTITLNL